MEKARTILHMLAAALAAAGATGLVRRLPAASTPQVSGGDPVAIVLGDVRTLVGRKMVVKADEYFHGGVTDIDCSLGHSHHHHDHDGHDDHDDHDGHDEHHGHDEHGGHDDDEAAAVRAPWAFVTRAVRLPSIERHLQGTDSREMLPWLWAACRVDSGNVNAYANAAYVLESLYGDFGKAIAVLDEGIAANPGSAELEFQKGSVLLLRLKDAGKARLAFESALAKIPRDKKLANRDDLDADLMMLRTLAFLGRIAHDEGDRPTVLRYLKRAQDINPAHSATAALRKLAEEPPAP